MRHKKAILLFVFVIAGCTVEQNRAGYADAWYYERLTPYFANDLALQPRVHLRAVRELVGIPIIFEDGSKGHADYFREDIEIFFAKPVTTKEERANLIHSAIGYTCPQTDIDGAQDKISYFDDTYVVLQNVSCLGHAP
ncbi:hypothetical protein [Halocynthiibacter namhaensis]|uniref:hypothetical protein n=1 Tax=Halocynthiibacter namhaensis TaxID=1290553 RepID=UPI0005793AC2|nr:hypothetical protein [Halocynthiibacter namhaensis]